MKLLEERIRHSAQVVDHDIVKVDMFLNHQIDVGLLAQLGEEFYRCFGDKQVTRILTAEASGIALACMAALVFRVPVVYAKKGQVRTQGSNVYKSKIFSYTRGKATEISVSKDFLQADDRILIIDDFLASGNAVLGLKDLVDQAGAQLVGVGIAIEKGFQDGGKKLREMGIPLCSLAIIAAIENGSVLFHQDNAVK